MTNAAAFCCQRTRLCCSSHPRCSASCSPTADGRAEMMSTHSVGRHMQGTPLLRWRSDGPGLEQCIGSYTDGSRCRPSQHGDQATRPRRPETLVAGQFFRREVRVRASACLAGMLSSLERKTACSLAEHALGRRARRCKQVYLEHRGSSPLDERKQLYKVRDR